MKPGTQMPLWTIGAPVLAVAILAAAMFGLVGGGFLVGLAALGLAGSVFAAVHHAEVVAHRVGEPLGTLVLVLRTGRTIILHGVILLTLFVVYLFTTIVP